MELWIRSQDKMALTKYDLLILEKVPKDSEEYMFIADHYKNMGIYKTKERALEVLDEIHQRLINLGTIEIVPDSYTVLPKDTSNVYEMPKE